MTESFEDQLSRVRLMASGDPTWDLSPNDQAALKAFLKYYELRGREIDLLRAQRRLAVDVLHEIRAGVNLGYSDVAMQRIDALIEDLSR